MTLSACSTGETISATIGGTTMEVRPFTIHVPNDVLDDLRQRLGHTRFAQFIRVYRWLKLVYKKRGTLL
jgi:hypothetical protein